MPITVDGSGNANYNASGGTTTATFSTSLTNDILVAVILCNSGSVTGISSTSGYTWHQLDILSDGSLEMWWTLATSALTSEVLTWTCNAAYTSAAVLAYNGCNTSSPWNTGAALNKSTASPSDPISGTTTVANTMGIGGHRVNTAFPTAGSSETGLSINNGYLIQEYQAGQTDTFYISY